MMMNDMSINVHTYKVVAKTTLSQIILFKNLEGREKKGTIRKQKAQREGAKRGDHFCH